MTHLKPICLSCLYCRTVEQVAAGNCLFCLRRHLHTLPWWRFGHCWFPQTSPDIQYICFLSSVCCLCTNVCSWLFGGQVPFSRPLSILILNHTPYTWFRQHDGLTPNRICWLSVNDTGGKVEIEAQSFTVILQSLLLDRDYGWRFNYWKCSWISQLDRRLHCAKRPCIIREKTSSGSIQAFLYVVGCFLRWEVIFLERDVHRHSFKTEASGTYMCGDYKDYIITVSVILNAASIKKGSGCRAVNLKFVVIRTMSPSHIDSY